MTSSEKQLLSRLFQEMSVRLFRFIYSDIKKISGCNLIEEITQTCMAMKQAEYTADELEAFLSEYGKDNITMFSSVPDMNCRVFEAILEFPLDEWIGDNLTTYEDTINLIFAKYLEDYTTPVPIENYRETLDISNKFWGPIAHDALLQCALFKLKLHYGELPYKDEEVDELCIEILDYIDSMGNMELPEETAKYYLPYLTTTDKVTLKSHVASTGKTLLELLKESSDPVSKRIVEDVYKNVPYIDTIDYKVLDYVPLYDAAV